MIIQKEIFQIMIHFFYHLSLKKKYLKPALFLIKNVNKQINEKKNKSLNVIHLNSKDNIFK